MEDGKCKINDNYLRKEQNDVMGLLLMFLSHYVHRMNSAPVMDLRRNKHCIEIQIQLLLLVVET